MAAVLITLPIYILGIPGGNDLPQHYQFAQTFRESILGGTAYPSWAASANFGYGDVGVRFYPPLAYYVLNAFMFAAGHWYEASVLTFAFWFFISGAGVYLWVREWADGSSSLIAAVAYMLMPYHVNQIYNAFLYAEFAAGAILPFCFLFVARICRRGKWRDVMLLAVAYSLLILTHLPLTVIGSICLFVYAIASIKRERAFPSLAKLGLSVLAALLAASFYWFRVFTEMDLVRVTTAEFAAKEYDFRSNFLLSYFSVGAAEYSDRSLLFSDLMLVVSLALILSWVAISLFTGRRIERRHLIPALIILATAVFFATPASRLIWERVTFVASVQFPWRWLSVVSLAGAFLLGASFADVRSLAASKLRPLGLVAIGFGAICLVFTAAQVIRPAIFIPKAQFSNKIGELASTPSCECMWPIGSSIAALEIREPVIADGRKATLHKWEPNERVFSLEPGPPTIARVATFYYPRWEAIINGIPSDIRAAADGAIEVPVNEDHLDIVVRFRETSRVRAAFIVSALTWLLIFGTLVAIRLFGASKRGLGSDVSDRPM
jgi:hypothetical protein